MAKASTLRNPVCVGCRLQTGSILAREPPEPHRLMTTRTSRSQPPLVAEHALKSPPLQACLMHSWSIMLLAAYQSILEARTSADQFPEMDLTAHSSI